MNSIAESDNRIPGEKFHRIICGPIAIISVILRILCVIIAVTVLLSGISEAGLELSNEVQLDSTDIVYVLFLLISSSIEIPLDFILCRLKRSEHSVPQSYLRNIARGIYWIALISRIADLSYFISDSYRNAGENLPFIIGAVVLACFSLIVLIYYRVNKGSFSAILPVNAEWTVGRAKNPSNTLTDIKSIVFAGFIIAACAVAAMIISDKLDGRNYPNYSREDMILWLDESWKGHKEHSEKTYSYQITDDYSPDIVQNDINNYLHDVLFQDLNYCYDVDTCKAYVTSESGHLIVTADFKYNDNSKKYEDLSRFETKEEALRELEAELRDGTPKLTFLVSSDWTLDDVDILALELRSNDVHTAAEWKTWIRSISNLTDSGMHLVVIEKEYDVNEEYLESCSLELDNKLSEIAAKIEEKGYTEYRDMYKAIAEEVITLASYDDSTRINSLIDSLSDEEKVKRSAHGALVTGETVCSGYAYAYKALCDKLGLPCQVISGYNGNSFHSWNMIEDSLFIDCTFCDTSYSRRFLFMDKNALDRNDYYISSNQLFLIEPSWVDTSK